MSDLHALSFAAYQRDVLPRAVYPGQGTLAGLAYTALGLTGESGEVADKVKKLLRDKGYAGSTSMEDVDEDVRRAILREVGDVLWYVTALAAELGFSLADVAAENAEKLASRAARGTLHGSGDNR